MDTLDATLEKKREARNALVEELAKLEAEVARRSLAAFTKHAWAILEPDRQLVWNWHLDILCDELEKVTRGETPNLLINVPPGTMKTLMCSVIWPAWEWATDPSLIYLAASYSLDRSIDSARKLRDVVLSAWYQKHFRVRFRPDQDAKSWFITTAGGAFFATSTNAKGTGWHPDRKIVDDPHSAEQARSELERTQANSWFDGTLSSRGVSRGARTVVIMQRLHEDDMTGHLLKKGGFRHLRWPMRYEVPLADTKDPKYFPPDPCDPRTEPGQLLWPELFPEDKVAQLERDLGHEASGQLQQRPTPAGGGQFRGDWFHRVKEAPKVYWRKCRAWDVAGTEGGGKRTAGVLITDAGPDAPAPRFYIEHVVLGQWSSHNVDQRIQDTAQMDGRGVSIREEQEGGSAGKAVIEDRRRKLAGFDYDGVPPSGDKEVRAAPFRSQCEGRNVAIVEGPWVYEYIKELESFPNGTFKDQVDASAHAFNFLTSGPRPAQVRKVVWG